MCQLLILDAMSVQISLCLSRQRYTFPTPSIGSGSYCQSLSLTPCPKAEVHLRQFWKMEQAFLLRTKKPNSVRALEDIRHHENTSGCSHLLAIFTLEAKKHSFPTDCAGLRHPVLGGKPVGKKQKTFKGKVVVTGLSLEG